MLQAAVARAARTGVLGSFGAKSSPCRPFPGIVMTQRAVDAIYNEEPATLRARLHAARSVITAGR